MLGAGEVAAVATVAPYFAGAGLGAFISGELALSACGRSGM